MKRRGDIIVFTNHYHYPSNPSLDYQYTDHVAMVVEVSSDEKVTLLHSVSSESSYYDDKKLSGLCYSQLVNRTRQQDLEDRVEDRYYDVHYEVFRFHNSELAQEAFRVLSHQAKFRLPYDEKRLQAKLYLEDQGVTGKDFMERSERAYPETGLYRAVKFAARFPHPWTRVRTDGFGRGITCAMAVILAYQVAELLIKDCVHPMNVNQWISDKYGSKNPASSYSPRFLSYTERLRSTPPESSDSDHLLSADFWNKDNAQYPDIESFTHESYCLDSKTTGAEGLALYMKKMSQVWHSLGPIEIPAAEFTLEERAKERARRRESFSSSMTELGAFTVVNPRVVSNRPSPKPLNPENASFDSSMERSPFWLRAVTPTKDEAERRALEEKVRELEARIAKLQESQAAHGLSL